jgi:hypothetical protein
VLRIAARQRSDFPVAINFHHYSPAFATTIDIRMRQIHSRARKPIGVRRKQIRNHHNHSVNCNVLASARENTRFFREKRDAGRVVRIIRDTVDGCIKSFTYPSCDPALTARFVNTRLVIRLSPISMDTA